MFWAMIGGPGGKVGSGGSRSSKVRGLDLTGASSPAGEGSQSEEELGSNVEMPVSGSIL